jgi:hypothetical protein
MGRFHHSKKAQAEGKKKKKNKIHNQQDRKQEAGRRFRLHAEAQEHLEFFLQFPGRKIC